MTDASLSKRPTVPHQTNEMPLTKVPLISCVPAGGRDLQGNSHFVVAFVLMNKIRQRGVV